MAVLTLGYIVVAVGRFVQAREAHGAPPGEAGRHGPEPRSASRKADRAVDPRVPADAGGMRTHFLEQRDRRHVTVEVGNSESASAASRAAAPTSSSGRGFRARPSCVRRPATGVEQITYCWAQREPGSGRSDAGDVDVPAKLAPDPGVRRAHHADQSPSSRSEPTPRLAGSSSLDQLNGVPRRGSGATQRVQRAPGTIGVEDSWRRDRSTRIIVPISSNEHAHHRRRTRG